MSTDAPAAVPSDLPCPRCSQRRIICYRLDNERGEHMHTRYACTFWGSGQPRACGWLGWTVPGWDGPETEGAST